MENGGLPVFSGASDHMRLGFRSLETEMGVAQHPVRAIQKKSDSSLWSSKLDQVRRVYGSSLAMRLATEKQIFDRSHRLGDLESSKIMRDTMIGMDDKIQFEDVLNIPSERVDIPKLSIHSQMEIKLGLL